MLSSKKLGESLNSSAIRRTVSKILIYELAFMACYVCDTNLIGRIMPISKLVANVIGMVEIESIFENCDVLNGESILKKIIEK